MSSALVVLSGGQDSTTCLFWAKKYFDTVHAVTFNYGQKHHIEIESALKVGKMAGVASHEVIHVEDILVSTSPLTNPEVELERYADFKEMDAIIGDRVEKTFVPMRNTLFLTIAANRAVALDCKALVTGVCQEDNANYPDCRLAFIQSLQMTINLSLGFNPTNQQFEILTPLMHSTKAETVKLARELPGCWEALAYSHTSYDGKYPPTDMNHANVLRAQGFLEANEADPLVIRAWMEDLMELPDTPNYQHYLLGLGHDD